MLKRRSWLLQILIGDRSPRGVAIETTDGFTRVDREVGRAAGLALPAASLGLDPGALRPQVIDTGIQYCKSQWGDRFIISWRQSRAFGSRCAWSSERMVEVAQLDRTTTTETL